MAEDNIIEGWIMVLMNEQSKMIFKLVQCPVPVVVDGCLILCDEKAFLFHGSMGLCLVHGVGIL